MWNREICQDLEYQQGEDLRRLEGAWRREEKEMRMYWKRQEDSEMGNSHRTSLGLYTWAEEVYGSLWNGDVARMMQYGVILTNGTLSERSKRREEKRIEEWRGTACWLIRVCTSADTWPVTHDDVAILEEVCSQSWHHDGCNSWSWVRTHDTRHVDNTLEGVFT